MTPMKLFVVRVNAGSDGSGLAEIERRGFDRFQLTGRNEPGVHWGEAGRVPGEPMVQDVALSREIEVRMIREIDRGVFVDTPTTVLTIPIVSFPSSSRSK